jgi:hypothetical protein
MSERWAGHSMRIRNVWNLVAGTAGSPADNDFALRRICRKPLSGSGRTSERECLEERQSNGCRPGRTPSTRQ